MNPTTLTTPRGATHARSAGGAAVLATVFLLLAPPAEAGGKLFFTDLFNPTFSDGFLRSCNTDGTGMYTIAGGLPGLRGVTVDPGQGKVYWTDVDHDEIRRANLDGSGSEVLVGAGLLFPMSIDLYDGGGRFFWGDQSAGHIRFASLDGWYDTSLGGTPFHAGIAIDEVNRKVYWTATIDSASGYIARVNLDGSWGEVILDGVGKPAEIALDVAGGKMYWTDYVQDVVRRANLDGSNVEDLYVVGANLNPGGIALDLAAGKVYWGQSHANNRMNIMRMNLSGSAPEVVVTGLGGIGELVFVETACPGDVDGDGELGFNDLLHILSNWGPCP